MKKTGLNKKEQEIVDRIVRLIREHRSFLITSHITLDGDSVGCEAALFSLLKRLKKKVAVINHHPVPENYSFIPGTRHFGVFQPGLKRSQADAVFILDCGGLDRIGKVRDLLPEGSPIVVIDHHLSKRGFGNIAWADSAYAAAGEMLYHVLAAFGRITAPEATGIYTALLTDTGSFQYHFGPRTFLVAQALLASGIDPQSIAARIYFDRPLRSVRLLARCLATLQFDETTGACWMRVTDAMCRETGSTEEDTERFIDVLRAVREAEVVFILKERHDGVKASFRSRKSVNVEKIAGLFGGGGHREAAGCFLENRNMERAEREILAALRKKWTA